MPSVEHILAKRVALNETVAVPVPNLRTIDVDTGTGVATIDGVTQTKVAFGYDLNQEIVSVINHGATWPKGATLVISWQGDEAAAGGDFLPLAGGLMTGPISFGLEAKKWDLTSTDGATIAAKASSRVGTNFDVNANNFRVCNAATPSAYPFGVWITIPSNGVANQITGYLDGANPTAMFKVRAQFQNNPGWEISMPNADPRTGGNAGANFEIGALGDAAENMPTALKIDRATGRTTLIALTLSPLPVDALDDAAAATAGVPVGGLYCNGSALMIRKV